MDAAKLQKILDLHGRWVKNTQGGERADLRWVDLHDANLHGMDLCGANLRGADLCGADLCKANLYRADLREANLYGADLREADLRDADLRLSNLRSADLYKAKGIEHLIFASALGSRKDTSYWDFKNDILYCGCFRGTIEEFSAKVEQIHKNKPVHLAEYQAMIHFFKEVKAAREHKNLEVA
jgi:uncharacterized protein YjbI with pentapeptide repeats